MTKLIVSRAEQAYNEWIFIIMPSLLHRISVENVNGYYLLAQVDI